MPDKRDIPSLELAEVISIVPHQLGFNPSDYMVALLCSDQKLLQTASMPLDESFEREARDQLRNAAAADGATKIVLLAYTDDAEKAHKALVTIALSVIERVEDACWVDGDTFIDEWGTGTPRELIPLRESLQALKPEEIEINTQNMQGRFAPLDPFLEKDALEFYAQIVKQFDEDDDDRETIVRMYGQCLNAFVDEQMKDDPDAQTLVNATTFLNICHRKFDLYRVAIDLMCNSAREHPKKDMEWGPFWTGIAKSGPRPWNAITYYLASFGYWMSGQPNLAHAAVLQGIECETEYTEKHQVAKMLEGYIEKNIPFDQALEAITILRERMSGQDE